MALGRAHILSILLLVAGLVSGCHRGARIEVTDLPDGRMAIEVIQTDTATNGVCVGTMAIHEGSAGGAIVWALRRIDDGNECRRQFTFPDVPPGYELDGQYALPEPLKAGETYWLQVRGPDGLLNGRYFERGNSVTPADRPKTTPE